MAPLKAGPGTGPEEDALHLTFGLPPPMQRPKVLPPDLDVVEALPRPYRVHRIIELVNMQCTALEVRKITGRLPASGTRRACGSGA